MWSAVEAAVAEVVEYGIRNEILHGVTRPYTLADVAGRQKHDGAVEMAYGGVLVEIGDRHIRSVVNVYFVMLEYLFVVFPFVEGGEIIAAHDEYESSVRVFFFEVGEGIDGVGWTWQSELDV